MKEPNRSEPPMNASQVLHIMADVEIDGIEFYSYMAARCQLPRLQYVANELIEAEKRHRDRFLDYAKHYRKYAQKNVSLELLPPTLRMLNNLKIFPAPTVLEHRRPAPADKDFLHLAIEAERASVILVKAFMPYILEEHHAILHQVLKEERTHVTRLERFLHRHFPENPTT